MLGFLHGAGCGQGVRKAVTLVTCVCIWQELELLGTVIGAAALIGAVALIGGLILWSHLGVSESSVNSSSGCAVVGLQLDSNNTIN